MNKQFDFTTPPSTVKTAGRPAKADKRTPFNRSLPPLTIGDIKSLANHLSCSEAEVIVKAVALLAAQEFAPF